ncbi:NAD(P)/FAD-dependent oxidoreductase [Frigidibacter sp. ROC022]|uniref:NAD(P)/FAD-dependent oxidoreductase n=1 Tax=Frigidibacter sp. ROC022 TaxID=2971796 RepID=UPI00215AA474|nr:FAD-dependent oxidoreductase [Frigidibacter sp. ROC022]MCR8726506.1 FAD-binding oxidoreductase [Frigidibacter sp. ROC022]
MATDVTVRGAGIFGLSCAWALARRGARVRVVDPGGPGAGASGGVLGALAPHVPENWNPKKQFQLDSLLAAEGFWAEIAAASGLSPGYARQGRLQPVADADAEALARRRAGTAAELWHGAALWEVVPVSGADWEPPSPSGLLIRDTLSARLHPRRAVAALAGALAAQGVEIVTEAPDRGMVLHASGAAGLEALSQALGKTVGRGVKGQAALLGHAAPQAPQLFVEALHVVPHEDGTTAIGSTDERDATTAEPDEKLEALIAKARRLVPALAEAPVLERWAGFRPRARSRAPMLGPWPGREGHYVANGGFKIGFGMAPGVAAVMADLMLDGQDRIPPGFRVEDNL